MNAIAIKHKPTTRINYTGVDEGAVPVKVYRKAQFIVAHVGAPEFDSFFSNEFISVKFVEADGTVFANHLFVGHKSRLPMLKEGNTVELVYDTDTGWIKSIDGERWN